MHANKQSTLTLVFYLTLALSLLTAHASPERRSHVNLNRILKKRAPQATNTATTTAGGVLGPLIGAQNGATTADTQTTPPADTTTDAARTTATPGGTGLIPSLSNILPGTSSSSSSASSSSASASSSASLSSSSASLSTSSVSSTSSSSIESTSTPATPSTSVVKGVTTMTTAVAAQSSAASEKSGAVPQGAKNIAVTVLIAVGASVGGIVILWTVFRKWKLARSNKSDSRMQPIDWQPTGADDMLPGANRRLSAGSFRSHLTGDAHGHGSDDGHSSQGHGRMAALPEHDFTAGPSHLAPVGGYADLARGPSPQPQMQEMGHSGLTHPGYDNQVPLHHQGGAYGGQDAYNYRY